MAHLSFNVAFLSVLLGPRAVEGALSNRSGAAFQKEMMYTQNSLCRQNYCTNPIFPGINDLPRLEALTWQCSTSSATRDYMDFCKEAVVYDPALPSPQKKAKAVADLVKAQEDAAMTMFVYHLNGMGYDAWDHRSPSESDSDCVRSVWKMVCYTYFPRAEAGCKAGEVSQYKRPCMSSCHNYIHQCGVECCDESVQCVFAHTSTSATGQVQLLQTGYVDQTGPSAACTGGTSRSVSSPLLLLLGIFGLHFLTSSSQTGAAKSPKTQRRFGAFSKLFLLCLLGLSAVALQGCDAAIPRHAVGNWRKQVNYLSEFKYIPAGKSAKDGVLNSCNQANVTANQQCSGRGYCKSFSTSGLAIAQSGDKTPLAFCQCERDWADPECGTKRKSQRAAFFWSLFGGVVGADYFYLGFPLWGMGKAVTLGGCGFWWLLDVVRTGTGPVYAQNFRTANDLPHWVAVMLMVFLFMTLGFIIAIQSYLMYRKQKRADILLESRQEEARAWKKTEKELNNLAGPNYQLRSRFPGGGGANVGDNYVGRPGFSGYGATMPIPLLNQSVAYATGADNTVGPFGPAGIPGTGSPTPAAIPGCVAPTNIEGLNRDPRFMPQSDPVYYPPTNETVVIEN